MIVASESQVVGSARNEIAAYDWRKVLKGFWYGQGGAAFIAFLTQIVALWNTGSLDLGLGAWAVFLAPFISSAINAALRWLQDTRVVEVKEVEAKSAV